MNKLKQKNRDHINCAYYNSYCFTYLSRSGNIISLNDSIENYDYLIFEFDNWYESKWSYAITNMFAVDVLKSKYCNDWDCEKASFIIYNSGDAWNRCSLWFKNKNTLVLQYGRSAENNLFTKIRITDIKGIKF